MITITKKGVDYQIKNLAIEINLSEMDKIFIINNNDEMGAINKRIEQLKVLGLPSDIANNLGIKSLLEITKETLITDSKIEQQRTFEVEGVIYEAYQEDEEFELSSSQLAQIEDLYRRNVKDLTSQMMAIIFKGDNTREERAKLFGEHMSAEVSMPYIAYIQINVIDNINQIYEQ